MSALRKKTVSIGIGSSARRAGFAQRIQAIALALRATLGVLTTVAVIFVWNAMILANSLSDHVAGKVAKKRKK